MEEKSLTLIEDALRLAKNIVNSVPSSEIAFVVTITPSSEQRAQPSFMDEEYIFPAFGYTQPRVPELLIQEEIMEAYEPATWFQKIGKYIARKSNPLTITEYGWKKGYLKEHIEEVRLVGGGEFDYFHTYTFWTTRENLHLFIRKYEQNGSMSDDPTKNFAKYHKSQLTFVFPDGATMTASFFNAKELRPVFETFWELRNNKPIGTTLFEAKDFYTTYEKLFKKQYERVLSDDVSNLRKLVRNSGIPEDRFKLEYNRSTENWLFVVV